MSRQTTLNAIEQRLIECRETASRRGDDVLAYIIEVAIREARAKKREKIRKYPRLVWDTSANKVG